MKFLPQRAHYIWGLSQVYLLVPGLYSLLILIARARKKGQIRRVQVEGYGTAGNPVLWWQPSSLGIPLRNKTLPSAIHCTILKLGS